ncbi:hypothetical protein PHYSODRAFT_341101 [Phytophthora sojae]|uniref:PiggyBac transposable element-derived protein 4 C-terminal zinc-ribbon domain-containing protein n=1 Tax=Phytophthora sojae (strain P6497) TaxID=1094619 RepID=G5AC60_PHYSP|nr:hypothetical protein PHYSODRAFT_341101 [Phytophthora sojae]EGZ06934.1 hypothetical protein PHYSODRAFT_341101 [Phytophthora sojae]|eukprot:XP_009537698.1 hypothetical protein PHYSODRAFT_341101 [Phytophthora sojae]
MRAGQSNKKEEEEEEGGSIVPKTFYGQRTGSSISWIDFDDDSDDDLDDDDVESGRAADADSEGLCRVMPPSSLRNKARLESGVAARRILHLPAFSETRHPCFLCSRKARLAGGQTKQTRKMCDVCWLHLCLNGKRNCFAEFHS